GDRGPRPARQGRDPGTGRRGTAGRRAGGEPGRRPEVVGGAVLTEGTWRAAVVRSPVTPTRTGDLTAAARLNLPLLVAVGGLAGGVVRVGHLVLLNVLVRPIAGRLGRALTGAGRALLLRVVGVLGPLLLPAPVRLVGHDSPPRAEFGWVG